MAFFGGLASIGRNIAGKLGGAQVSPDLTGADQSQPASRFQRSLGGLSSGLGSLSANLMGMPTQPAMPALKRRQGPKPLVPQARPSLPGALAPQDYGTPDFAPGVERGGFAT